MYAVFEDGSRQYRVSKGDLVTLDYREANPGDELELSSVLLYVDGDEVQIGQPMLGGTRVLAEVVDHPSKKYVIQYFRRRKNSRRLKGHRQKFTRVKIKHILLPGMEPTETEEQAPPKQEAPESPAPEEKTTPDTPEAPTSEEQSSSDTPETSTESSEEK